MFMYVVAHTDRLYGTVLSGIGVTEVREVSQSQVYQIGTAFYKYANSNYISFSVAILR